jgi:hypothetical protein
VSFGKNVKKTLELAKRDSFAILEIKKRELL